jgi:hypothetical protein
LIIPPIAFGIWILLRFVLKNSKKAGLIVSLFFFLFFFYGHIYNVLTNEGSKEFFLSQTNLLFVFLIPLIGGIGYFVITKRKLDNATLFANVISFTLLVIVFINIGSYTLETYSLNSNAEMSQSKTLVYQSDMSRPDIYYILLDAYPNNLILEEYLDYDNSKFIDFLTKKDFYVPLGYTHSNYPITTKSVPSILNMNWVHELIPKGLTEKQAVPFLYKKINQNLVMQNFKSLGYNIFSFDSGWWGTRKIDIADQNLCENLNIDWRVLNELKDTTMISAIKIIDINFSSKIFSQKRELIICEFTEIKKIRERVDGPIFVFAHFVAPHPPWVFESDGTLVKEFVSTKEKDLEKRRQAEINQLTFVNSQVENVIEHLISNSRTQLIIVIQSDHGTRNVSEEKYGKDEGKYIRMGNFNAFLFPGNTTEYFSEEINNVNTFRIIFNKFYNGTYDLLENKVFLANYQKEIENWKDLESRVVLTKLNYP